MNPKLIALLLLAASVTPAIAAPADVAAIRATLDKLRAAWERGDRAAAMAIYDPGLIDTDPNGVRRELPGVLAFLRPTNTKSLGMSLRYSDYLIKVHGDAAVATYRFEDCRELKGARECERFRASDFLVKRAGAWRVVGAHQAPVREEARP